MVETEVLVEAAQHQHKLLSLIPPPSVPILAEPFFGLGQELSATLDAWNPNQHKPALAIRATYVGEAEEVKRVRLSSYLCQVGPSEAAETFHSRLFLCQLQTKFPESIRQALVEPFANQAQDQRISNAMGYHLPQPSVLDVVEVSSDVSLEHVPPFLAITTSRSASG
ncbi:MAG TPA: hypothetical protein VFP71_06125 [Candidatus Angelobacter sp.]|nr:hypothetical protein [Candidatus Angelobacter sp.]